MEEGVFAMFVFHGNDGLRAVRLITSDRQQGENGVAETLPP